jgi:hypothetical protein
MKKHIAEDLPARQHPQAQLSNQSKKPDGPDKGSGKDSNASADKTPEERISQAASDIRYRARRENIPLRQAYSQYMQNSSIAESEKAAVREKLFGKGGMQAENFDVDMKVSASDSMAKALYKVFVDNQPKISEEKLKEDLEKNSNSASDRKYKVRVTDKETGVTYTRFANREKISQLRAKGLEVEMTEYGTPYEGERTKGEKTSEVLNNRAKRDYDRDGKVESGAKEHAGAVHNAIQRKKGGTPNGQDTSSVKEAFIGEVSKMANLPQTDLSASSNPNDTQLDILPRNKKNTVVVNPSNTVLAHTELQGKVIVETGYSKFLEILQEKKMTAKQKAKEKKLKKKYDPSGMKANMEQEYGKEQGKKVYFASIRKQSMKEASECESDDAAKMNLKKDEKMDSRSIQTAMSLAKIGARYRGIKNPMVMVATEETVEEGLGLSVGISKAVGSLLSNPRTSPEQGAKSFQKNLADPIGKAVKGAARAVLQPANMSPEAQKARNDKYRPEEVEFGGEIIDEKTRYAKETGINFRKQKAQPKGGSAKNDKAFQMISKLVGSGRVGSAERGKKKVPGEKPPAAGESGGPISPAQKVKKNRDIVKRGEENMSSRFD